MENGHPAVPGMVSQDAASALFGVEGLQVADVEAGPGGAVEVWTVTDWPAAAACPDCGTVSSRLHETVVTQPRDVRRAGDPVDLRWVKRRWKCAAEACTRGTFTEWLPAVPPRCRISRRLREQAASEVPTAGSPRRRRPGTPGSPGRRRRGVSYRLCKLRGLTMSRREMRLAEGHAMTDTAKVPRKAEGGK